jgi:predicted MFS family arabinose efflux permease
MDRKLLWLLAIATMFCAGNLYYAQPLLGEMARTFNVSQVDISFIPVLAQFGYVLALIFISPLGDIFEKRKLILTLLVFQILTLMAAAFSANFLMLQGIALTIGISSVLVQIIIPLVASLSSKKDRAKNLGLMISCALIGILLSRAISGFVAARFGWRYVYGGASTVLIFFFIILYFTLPKSEAQIQLSYKKLLFSLFELVRDVPDLRRIAINGALIYAGLCAFWASLIFYLESSTYNLGSMAAGAFGIVGAIGAASASSVSQFIHRYGSKKVLRGCMILMGLSFLIMNFFGASFIGLIFGVIILDIGAQAATVTNQNELYAMHVGAQARLNTIYKGIYFIGGGIGTAVSAFGWKNFGWSGVCWVGFIFIVAAGIWESVTAKK